MSEHEKAFVKVTVHTSAMEVLDEVKSDDRKKPENEMYHNVLNGPVSHGGV